MKSKYRSFFFFCFFLGPTLPAAVDYEKDVRPVLGGSCLECHGPDTQKSGFRVDQRSVLLKGGDSGLAAIVPGKPKASPLLEAVKSSDPDTRMPPKGKPLTPLQIALLEKWISEGAVISGQTEAVTGASSTLWSLQPVVRPAVPQEAGGRKEIDAFLVHALGAKQLGYNPPADSRELVRRASVVLTGLPPTPERVGTFLAASKADAPAAYTALIEELLASPHFGERWAQHWLDVIRWAESNGSESNLYRKNAWLYRDYVVAALNDDVPYDRFVREQIAGDQMGVGEATGFLVAGPHVPAATVGQEPSAIRQARADRMDEVLQSLGASILGMTVGCARCHNHKFDPITIQDYYALTAVFQGVEFGGRPPELTKEHPRQLRAETIQQEMLKERATLRAGAGQWVEDWGGFTELQFPATHTSALRIDFNSSWVGVDELEVFGPVEHDRNLAHAATGTRLAADETMAEPRGELRKANDGAFGTQQWMARSPKGSAERPWVEIRFSQPQEVNRFRLSSNRDHYFETDYIDGGGGGKLAGFTVSAKLADGSWREVGKTKSAEDFINSRPALKSASARLHELIGQLAEEGPRHSFIGRFQQAGVTKVFRRGSPESPGEEVVPAGFAILKGDLGLKSSSPEAERRKAFADWMTRAEHPLTARVFVNRVWKHIFGAGLVTTGSDFGKAGALPSHPELLDWLAAEFVRPQDAGAKPWGVKDLIRRLVMSEAFRQSSVPREDGLRADAGNALLWRFSPRRVEAEVVRDSILQATGKLDRTIGGRSYRIHNVKKTYAQWEVTDNHGPHTWRRMLYQERMRRVDDQIFTAFDFPDCGQVRDKRPVSTTPLQALNLMNSPFVVEQADFLVERVVRDVGADDPAREVRRCFELLLQREPSAAELSACVEVVQKAGLAVVARTLINSNEFAFQP